MLRAEEFLSSSETPCCSLQEMVDTTQAGDAERRGDYEEEVFSNDSDGDDGMTLD